MVANLRLGNYPVRARHLVSAAADRHLFFQRWDIRSDREGS